MHSRTCCKNHLQLKVRELCANRSGNHPARLCSPLLLKRDLMGVNRRERERERERTRQRKQQHTYRSRLSSLQLKRAEERGASMCVCRVLQC